VTRTAAGSIDPVTTSAYESALRQLPNAYALVLRLTDADATDEEICSTLGIEPEGLDTLVELARRKLHRELTQR
jgi:DNA-directed RNA polymerase specialized sigma24 family protein